MRTTILTIIISGYFFAFHAENNPNIALSGDTTDRHTITFTVTGPEASETGEVNPFTDYKLIVYVQYMLSGAERYLVPGYYAADGNAGETGAESGNVWKAHFTPQWPGAHAYKVYFRTGPNVALSNDSIDGTPVEGIDGDTGTLEFKQDGDDVPPDLKALGRLDIDKYSNHLVLVKNGFSEKKVFLKAGTASPSNFLDYADFDNTPANDYTKTFTDHVADWQEGDPTWGGGEKGKGIIGALNYLASQGVNTVSFNTMTLGGADSSIYPFTSPDSLTRFDCSKLDQWLTVFRHANSLGMAIELRTQIAANDHLLDNGELGTNRILYYRELIARYAHCLGIMWNLGDENTQSMEQRIALANYLHSIDPHQHPSRSIILQAPEGMQVEAAQPIFESETTWVTGLSLQTNYSDVHAETKNIVDSITTLDWNGWSTKLRVVTSDCQLPKESGIPADDVTDDTPTQDDIRKYVLWGNLMAMGGGVSYFFGSAADLTCQNFRNYENLWSYYRHAENFFRKYLLENEYQVLLFNQLMKLTSDDQIISETSAYCLSLDGYQPFVVYLPEGGNARIDISTSTTSDSLRVWWYNPRTGGSLQSGELLVGGDVVPIGSPPSDENSDWAVLIIPNDAGNPDNGEANSVMRGGVDRRLSAGNIRSITTRNGIVRMSVPPAADNAIVEVIAANGKIVASSASVSGGMVELRLSATGIYLVYRKTGEERDLLARVLYM